ncbi:MAG: hypothetical protein PUE27_06880 [Sharpea porci]|uniref:hypothetical protein n=1 Tax=Sharpea porci TaxID=2652286 RepID=UPI00240A0C12|nr:hypothetical protein [Sharpea porci]MDD6711790.1 hypothetical protein [Sharpea porci]
MGIIFIVVALFLSTRVDFINGNMTHTALLPEYHYIMIVYIATLALYYLYRLHNHDPILQGLLYSCAFCLFAGILIPYTDNLFYEHAHIFFTSLGSLFAIGIVIRMIDCQSLTNYHKAMVERGYLTFVIALLSAIFFFCGQFNGLFEVTGLSAFVLFVEYDMKKPRN